MYLKRLNLLENHITSVNAKPNLLAKYKAQSALEPWPIKKFIHYEIDVEMAEKSGDFV